jgi:hypothetical protein
MLLFLALNTVALAQEAAFYHPEQIAKKSALFAAAAEASAPHFQTAQDIIGRYSLALEDLEVGVLIAASRLDSATIERAESLRREFMGNYMRTSAHVELLQTDYDEIFTGAMERALATDLGDYTVEECGATGVAALTGRSNCKGVDLNQAIASIIDQDAALAREVEEINGIPWPDLEVESETQPAVPLLGEDTQAASLIDVSKLGKTFLLDRIMEHQDDLDRSLSPLEDGLESNDEGSITAAQALRETYESAVAADGEELLEAVEASLLRLAKKKGLGAISLCVNPKAFGGCTGNGQSAELIQLLSEDRKFTKAVANIGS